MSVVQRVLRRPLQQFPERNIKRVLQQNSTLNGLAGLLTQGFENGIHLDFANNFHYIKSPGQDPFIAPFTSLFTFTGDNLSYYRSKTGILIPSATNTPRIEYDVNGKCLGLLVEGSRTNLGIQSNDMTNAAWVKTTMSTAKTATGPDGVSNSATTITSTAGNATVLQTVVSGSATRTYSVWLKRRTGTGNVDLAVDGVTWNTRAITTTWAKYELTQAAVTNPVFGIRLVTNGDAVDVWCNQLESASFASSSIPTVAASVARAADVNNRAIGTEFSNSKGTYFVLFDVRLPSSGIVYITGIDSSGPIFFNSGSIPQAEDPVNNVNSGVTVSSNTLTKLAFNYGVTGGMSMTVNNSTPVTNATFDGTWGASSNFGIGCNGQSSGNQLFGHINRLDYWPERKPNDQLQGLTL